MSDAETLDRLVRRLEEAAARLREGDLGPEEAAELVEQCAQGAAHASAELDRLARAAAAEPLGPPPSPDQLV